MATMCEKYECAICYEVYDLFEAARSCSFGHDLLGQDPPDPSVTVLPLWACEWQGCDNVFDSQFYAEGCETEHELAEMAGRSGLDTGKPPGPIAKGLRTLLAKVGRP